MGVRRGGGGKVQKDKQQWVRPQLIVLGRGTPEENVLAGCKTGILNGRSYTLKNCSKKMSSSCPTTQKCSVVSKTS